MHAPFHYLRACFMRVASNRNKRVTSKRVSRVTLLLRAAKQTNALTKKKQNYLFSACPTTMHIYTHAYTYTLLMHKLHLVFRRTKKTRRSRPFYLRIAQRNYTNALHSGPLTVFINLMNVNNTHAWTHA